MKRSRTNLAFSFVGASVQGGRSAPQGALPPSGRSARCAVRVVDQPPVHVSEAVLIRDEIDSAVDAELVEPSDVVRRHRRRIAPHDLVIPEREGVLGVELELVYPDEVEQVDGLLESLAGGDAVAADVEHVGPDGEVGPIACVKSGERFRRLLSDLIEKTSRVSQTSVVRVLDADAVAVDREFESLGREGSVLALDRLRISRRASACEPEVARVRDEDEEFAHGATASRSRTVRAKSSP